MLESKTLRTLFAALALTIGVAGVVGCSSDDRSSVISPDGNGDASSSTEAKPPADINVNVQPGTGEGYVGARTDVTAESCTREGDAWVTSGTVRNPTDQPADYRVYTSFNDDAGDLRALVQSDVSGVAPGADGEWRGTATAPEENLTCILRVERVTAAAE